jgi:hypothetical protein
MVVFVFDESRNVNVRECEGDLVTGTATTTSTFVDALGGAEEKWRNSDFFKERRNAGMT